MPEITPEVKCFFEHLCRDNPQVLFLRMKGGAPVHELRTWEDGLDTLPMWNDIGWDCFFTVGETDGSGSRRAENMVQPRALFIDLDNPANAERVKDFWLTQTNAPSAVVNTSPGKFHLYWFTEAGLEWHAWSHYQRLLAAQTNAKFGAGTADGSVCDASRIMRLPGSLHHKAQPYRGSVFSLTDRIYTLSELAAAFPKPPPAPSKAGSSSAGRFPSTPPNSPWTKYAMEGFNRLLATLTIERETSWGYVVICPNAHEHTTPGDMANLYKPSENNSWQGGFKCLHEHCRIKYGDQSAIRRLRELQLAAVAAEQMQKAAIAVMTSTLEKNRQRGAA